MIVAYDKTGDKMITIRDWYIEDALEFHKLSMDPYFSSRRFKQYLYPDTFLNTVTILETYRYADHHRFSIQAITNDKHICGYIQFEKKDDMSGELSYWIGREYWNHGIGTNAVKQMCKLVFNQFPVLKIYARVNETNIASQKVLFHNHFRCIEKIDDILIFELYK